MLFDFEDMRATKAFEFLIGTVVPQPMAFFTTLAVNGTSNAAPP